MSLVNSYVAFVLSLFVPYLSFFWCLVKSLFPHGGISLVSSFIFFSIQVKFLYTGRVSCASKFSLYLTVNFH